MMGLPFPFTLGTLHGLLLLVPYLGNALSLFMTMAIMMGKAPSSHVAGCVVAIFVLSQLVVWDRRHPLSRILHPVWVIFVLLISVLFLGSLGVLLSLPLESWM
jgi:predicted PurR-regulated permease PerM